jgi:hypothetical protein
MTQEEVREFKRLLALYLDITCLHCKDAAIEDRHILTCTACGVVLSDLKKLVGSSREGLDCA